LIRATSKRSRFWCGSVCLAACLWSASAAADIPLTDPAKTDGWLVSIDGQVDAYLSWVFGHTTNVSGLGNPVNPADPSNRYNLVGPQFGITGNPTPSGATADQINDTNISAPRIRGGFASTILGFKVSKQVNDYLKVSFRFGLWAGIQNGVVAGVRSQNDSAAVDWRDQYVQLEGPWGLLWGGRRLGLFNRGGMKMDWFLVHQHGVGNPCNVDSNGTAACGNTGVGSMFPNRNAQIGYATPEVAGLQLNIAMFDPSMIDTSWNRTPSPRFEAEGTYHHETKGTTDELNGWVNGLSQQIARIQEALPNPSVGFSGIPADAVRNVWGVGGGAWGRMHGFAIGGTAWVGRGLGTATPFGNTAVDDQGTLREHFGYLGAANYRLGDFEIAGSYGSSNCVDTDWDRNPTNPRPVSVIKEVRGIAANIAYHMGPVVFSIDGMNLHYTWHRGETQTANVVSAGLLGAF
jgi:hypothetical protein